MMTEEVANTAAVEAQVAEVPLAKNKVEMGEVHFSELEVAEGVLGFVAQANETTMEEHGVLIRLVAEGPQKLMERHANLVAGMAEAVEC